eukprot:UN33823
MFGFVLLHKYAWYVLHCRCKDPIFTKTEDRDRHNEEVTQYTNYTGFFIAGLVAFQIFWDFLWIPFSNYIQIFTARPYCQLMLFYSIYPEGRTYIVRVLIQPLMPILALMDSDEMILDSRSKDEDDEEGENSSEELVLTLEEEELIEKHDTLRVWRRQCSKKFMAYSFLFGVIAFCCWVRMIIVLFFVFGVVFYLWFFIIAIIFMHPYYWWLVLYNRWI